MSTIDCFWVEPTGEVMVRLRRYRPGGCRAGGPEGFGYCNESVDLGRAPVRMDNRGILQFVRPAEYADGPWPIECSACHTPFGPLGDGVSRVDEGSVNDQVNQEQIFKQPNTPPDVGEWPMDRLPPGAMFDAVFYHDWHVGPDGISLTVVCPYPGKDARAGFWHPDLPASNSDSPWTRTGNPRDPSSLTIRPSIQTGYYHGFLTNGQLVAC